jgi:hypothetical protein
VFYYLGGIEQGKRVGFGFREANSGEGFGGVESGECEGRGPEDERSGHCLLMRSFFIPQKPYPASTFLLLQRPSSHSATYVLNIFHYLRLGSYCTWQ